MSIKWVIERAEEIEVECPYCSHRAAPPVYPHCKHTVFVYLDPCAGDPGFDFITPQFAAGYLPKLKVSEFISQEDMELFDEAGRQLMQGAPPSFYQQEIRLFSALVSDDLFSSNVTIFDVTEKSGRCPCRVVAAFQFESGNEHEIEQDAPPDTDKPCR